MGVLPYRSGRPDRPLPGRPALGDHHPALPDVPGTGSQGEGFGDADLAAQLADESQDALAVRILGFEVGFLTARHARTAEGPGLLLDRGGNGVSAHREPIMAWNTARVSRGNA